MASEHLLRHGNHLKHTPYRKILYHRFFVGLLLFIVISLLIIVVYNAFCTNAPRLEVSEAVSLNLESVSVVKLKSELKEAAPRVINCTYWDCFNVYRCGRSGHNKITIYIYPLREYHKEDDTRIAPLSRDFYDILVAIRNSRYYTADPEEACLLVPSIDTLNQYSFSTKHVSQALQLLEQ